MQSRLFAAATIALLAIPLAAQLPTAREQIQVTVVEVPVNVVDRAGSPVRNLTAANFELLDNGQRRQITHFDAIDLAAPGMKSPETVPPAAVRNFLLVFDLNGSSPATLTKAKEAAHAFVANPAVRDDRIGVGTFSAEHGFRLLTSFTNDMKLVSSAIDTLGAPKLFQPADPLLLSSVEMRQQLDIELNGPAGRSTDFATEELRENIRNYDRAANDVQRQFIRRTLDGYADLAHILDRIPGRKQVILLTEGFDTKMIHGRESLTSQQAREEEQYILGGEAWRVDNDNRYGDPEVVDELKAMLQACRRSDVVLHAIDIRGVRTNADVRDTGSSKSNESLYLMTHDTGGMVFKNVNSLDEDFQRLLRAEEVVYVLGFEAPSSEPGKYHDLKVKVVNVPSAQAFARAGYFETSPALTPMERTLTAGEILLNRIPMADLRVRTLATPFPRSDGRAQVPVIVEVDGQSVLRVAKDSEIQSELFIYAFDQKNRIRDFLHQPFGLDLAKLRGRLQQHGLRVYETLMLPPGRYTVRTLVRAGKESFSGYSEAAIEVPAFDQAAVLGGSAIDDKPAEWVPVKPPDRQGVPHDYPFLIGGSMLVPSAAPVLHPGVAAHVGLYVEKLPAAGVNVAAAVNGKETAVKVAARTVAPDGTAKLLLDFIPPELPPGDYQLTLQVPDHGTAVVPFAVR